jgi:hypothetical protein
MTQMMEPPAVFGPPSQPLIAKSAEPQRPWLWPILAAVALLVGLLAGGGAGWYSGVGEREDLKDRNAEVAAQATELRGDLTSLQGQLDTATASSAACLEAGSAAELLSASVSQYLAADDAFWDAPEGSDAEAAAVQQLRQLYPQVQQHIGNAAATVAACRATAGSSG